MSLLTGSLRVAEGIIGGGCVRLQSANTEPNYVSVKRKISVALL